LQNIPTTKNARGVPVYRECFRPKAGYKYICCDFSQIEPRITAQESKDPIYIQTYQDGADLYIRSAEAMLGHEIDVTTPYGKLQRIIFKAVVLALAYRMGPWKLRDRLTLALEEDIAAGRIAPPTIEWARELRDRFFAVHAGLQEYQDRQSLLADPARSPRPKVYDDYAGAAVTYIKALCGRTRLFLPDAKNTYTEAANAPIQGHSATMVKYAAVLIQAALDADPRHIDMHGVNYVHDEIVYECPEAYAEEMALLVKAKMEEAGRRWVTLVPIVADFPSGTNGVLDRWLKEALPEAAT
jgi:DNA polymerase-1